MSVPLSASLSASAGVLRHSVHAAELQQAAANDRVMLLESRLTRRREDEASDER